MTANVLSPGQVSLWWNPCTNNEQTVYSVQRSLDSAHFTTVARVEGASFIDAGLETNTAYAYRVKASNLAGEADYTTTVAVVTATNGVDMPLAPGSLKLWLKSDDGAPPNFDGTLETWLDKSGNTNIVTYPTSANATRRPFYIQTTNQLNNHPVLRFYGSNWFEIRFTNAITNWTSAEAFVVLKAKSPTNTFNAGLWRIGQGNSLYPDSAGNIRDTFARDTPIVINNVWQLTANPHLYNPSSKPGEWTARIDGSTVSSTVANTVAFYTDTPTLGLGLNAFDGDIVECLIYNQTLTAGQRLTATEYLRRKSNLWP